METPATRVESVSWESEAVARRASRTLLRVVRTFHEWEVLECTPEHCEGLHGNYPKAPPGPEYDARLRRNMRDFTASHIPSELLFRPKVRLELQLGALLVAGLAYWLPRRAGKGRKDD